MLNKNTVLSLLATLMLFAGLPSWAAETPQVGSAAPGFRLQDQNGEWHDLADYRGRWLAVYFYPKDDTPGCTTEACNFRDNIFAFKAIGAELVGISVRKVLLPVAAGRNLAVLAEAAVRNYVLQLRGIDSTQEFIQRQEQQLSKRG